MDPNLYRAVMQGDIGFLEGKVEELNVQATSLNKNTVLHVATQFGQTRCADEILQLCPSLLCRKNIQDETPLHIAAREGHSDIVRVLIERAQSPHEGEGDEDLESGDGIIADCKEMLWMKNQEGDTALHEAVRNKFVDVVDSLIRADPKFVHSVNKQNESPLYIAAEKGHAEVLSKILEICEAPAYCGPISRTALHAAVFQGDQGSIEKLLVWKQALTTEVDAYGWTPLHCAARANNISGVRQLLEKDKSLAYITTADNDNKKTALHIAASYGCLSVMKEILSYYPDCWETTNAQGQNILHCAVEYEKTEVITYIVENSWVNHLLNQKDVDGNTPLHLLAASDCDNSELILRHTRANQGAFNKENMTPQEISTCIDRYRQNGDEINKELNNAPPGWRNIVSKDADGIRKRKKARAEDKKVTPYDITKAIDIQLIVAILIATVTFAAGFTLPGGYDGNEGPDQGMAILSRQSAFKAFVVTDTIALVFSVSAVLLNLVTAYYNLETEIISRAGVAVMFIIVAMAAMVIAFITGIYAVLGNSLNLAIVICALGCIAIFVYVLTHPKRCHQEWTDFWKEICNDLY